MIQTNLHELIDAENKKINEIFSPLARILRANLYNNKPVRAMDIVYAKRVEQNKSGYWYLWDYEYVLD